MNIDDLKEGAIVHVALSSHCREHDWGGWRNFEDGLGGEQFCQRCGMGAMSHGMRTGP